MKLQDVESVALRLGAEDRAALAHRLLVSLDDLSPEEHEQAWLEAAEKRVQELREGTVKGVPIEDVLNDVRRRLR